MGSDRRGDARERFLLGEYWNELVEDRHPIAPGDLDASLTETVRWLHAADPKAALDAGVDSRLKEHLMSGIVTVPTDPNGVFGRVTATEGWPEVTRPQRPLLPTRGRRALSHLATAALLVLTLGGIAVAFGGPQLARFAGSGTNGGGSRPLAISAPLATPGDPAGIASEPVFGVTFPDEAIPEEGTFYVDLLVGTWQPGASLTAAPRPDDNGPVATHVIEGTLAMRVDGPHRVFRADGSVEEAAPGTEVTVRPGDTSLQLDHGSGVEMRNAGATVLRFLVIGITERLDPSRFSFAGGAVGTDSSMHPGEWLKEGAVTATVRRVTAAPGTTLPPLDETGATSLYVEAGTLTWSVVEIATGATPVITPTYDAGRWVSWVQVSPDRKLIMRNANAEPLVYLAVTVAPVEEGAGA